MLLTFAGVPVRGRAAGRARLRQRHRRTPGRGSDQKHVALHRRRRNERQSDTKIYADDVEIFTDENRADRHRQRRPRAGRQPDRGGPRRLQHQDQARHVLQRVRASPRSSRRSSRRGRARSRCRRSSARRPTCISSAKRSRRSARRNTGSPTAASRPACSRRRAGTCTPAPIVLNIDHYTVLRNAIFSVKGVPMLYLPFLYYPTKKDDRATGFLIPTYGSSTLRGQSIHNAFFWAIDRSQDATFMHDWYLEDRPGRRQPSTATTSATATATSARTPERARGQLRAATTAACSPSRPRRSYEIRGAANQVLPFNLRGRGRTSTTSRASSTRRRSTRTSTTPRAISASFGGNVVGAWGNYALNGTLDHSEYFYDRHRRRALSGSWPRVIAHAQRAADSGHAGLFLRRRRVRQPAEQAASDTDPAPAEQLQPGR